ncbi:MAG: hypothetical protein JXA52_08595 [Planctomycetes bacterium]|nr:hypothetical protein [Planctomycetota bacterium]
MRKQAESILLTITAALVGMMLWQLVPDNFDYVFASAPGEKQALGQARRYYDSDSISGLQTEVLKFGDSLGGALTIVRDQHGKPLAHLDNAVPVCWSPVQDMLLLRKVGIESGYFLRDLSAHTNWNKLEVKGEVSPLFGATDTAAAVFSTTGKHVLLEGTDGVARQLSVVDLLESEEGILTAAVASDEIESALPDLPFDH